jgi:hypothetical protein
MREGKRVKSKEARINNVVIISDTHSGCKLSLCPPEGVKLDEGGKYQPSKFQRFIWKKWRYFCDVFVPETIHDEPFYLIHNGDALDGMHHGTTTTITNNWKDQIKIAEQVLAPVVERAARYYHIRGTEAHVGPSAQYEEILARNLGAHPDGEGNYSRYDLWLRFGVRNDILLHALHHIGSTGSQAYESTAVNKELMEAYVEAGRWGRRPPDVLVRSHRHRAYECKIPAGKGSAYSIVTPAWQGKTPFTWKIPGARQSEPQFGGVILREAPDGVWYPKSYTVSLERNEPEE